MAISSAVTPSLTTTLSEAGLELTAESLSEIAKCRNLHKLALECCVNMDDDTLKRILEGCPKLKYLEVMIDFYFVKYLIMISILPEIILVLAAVPS